jgi:hypothetical protein
MKCTATNICSPNEKTALEVGHQIKRIATNVGTWSNNQSRFMLRLFGRRIFSGKYFLHFLVFGTTKKMIINGNHF